MNGFWAAVGWILKTVLCIAGPSGIIIGIVTLIIKKIIKKRGR